MTKGQHLIGKTIGGCVLEKELGHGGSSAVFLAQQLTSEGEVAVKVFLPRSTMEPRVKRDFYARFLREAEAVSELEHPNILPVYSYGEEEGLPYIVMPYVDGGTLQEYLSKNGPLPLSEAQQYVEQIAAALDYAHQHGHVHCDVKPANILLDDDGRAMLSDFGIARVIEPEPSSQEHAKPESMMGTPDYISPEQALGQPLDGRSDVYSLAVTLFALLAGSPPFQASSAIAVALMQVHEKPPLLGLMRVDVTPEIDQVIGKALAKKPEERYQTAGEFSEAFCKAVEAGGAPRREVLAGQRPIIRLKPATPPHRLLAFPRIVLPLVLVLVVVLGIAVGAGLANSLAHPQTSQRPKTSVTPTPSGTDDLFSEQDDWPIGKTVVGTFFFQDGEYHLKNESAEDVAIALYSGNHQFTDFRLTVTTREVQGVQNDGDFYGVVFRATADQSHYYVFRVVPWGVTGPRYTFLRYDVGRSSWQSLAEAGAPSLKGGKSNTITVEARGNSFSFSINKHPVGKIVSDPSKSPLKSGEIGLYVEQRGTEVAFSHLQVTPPNNIPVDADKMIH